MNCKSVYGWKHPPASYISISLIYVSISLISLMIYLLTIGYMTSMTQDFKKLKKNLIFVSLVSFEIFSHYPNIDISHWLTEGVQWITDKKFIEKIMVQMASTPSRTFLLNFWFLPVSVVVLIVIRLIVISYWLPMHDQHKFTPMEASLSVFIDFRWKLLKLMAVKNLKIIFRKLSLNTNKS